jgi:hypothetical protein
MPVNGTMIGVVAVEYKHRILETGYYPGGGHATVSFRKGESVAWYSVCLCF